MSDENSIFEGYEKRYNDDDTFRRQVDYIRAGLRRYKLRTIDIYDVVHYALYRHFNPG